MFYLNFLARYPYKEVTPLALLLWGYFLPEVRTIVRIIYTTPKVCTIFYHINKFFNQWCKLSYFKVLHEEKWVNDEMYRLDL